MSRIGLHNYEAFYLDHLEGNLDAEAHAELLLFLENHPALKAELEGVQIVKLVPDSTVKMDKGGLVQEITTENAEEYMIAELENEISVSDEADLKAFLLANPTVQATSDRYQQTKLVAPVVVYEEKSKLKKRSGVLLFLSPLAAAASIVIALFVISTGPVEVPITAEVVVSNRHDEALTIKKSVGQIVASEELIEDCPTDLQATTALITVVTKKEPVPSKPESGATNSKEKGSEPASIPMVEPLLIKEAMPVTAKPTEFDQVAIQEPSEVAPVDVSQRSNQEQVIGANQWANQLIRKSLMNQEEPTTTPIEGPEILAALVDQVDRLSNAEIDYAHRKADGRRSYRFSIGKLEISRSVRR